MSDRKARLAALAARAGRTRATEEGPDGTERRSMEIEKAPAGKEEAAEAAAAPPPAFKFRNYVPKDAALDGDGQGGRGGGDTTTTIRGEGGRGGSSATERLESKAREAKRRRTEDDAKSSERTPLDFALLKAKLDAAATSSYGAGSGGVSGRPVDLMAMAPRKVNWDLKRDVKPKMDRLERRTQRAIVELLRERLEREAAERVGDDDDEDDNEIDLD